MSEESISSVHPRPRLAPVLGVVTIIALLIGGFSFSESHLWLYPDSRAYIELAVDIAERFDFSSEWFFVRTPGYPVLLAAIFAVFGQSSPMAILAVQHAMVVVVAVLTALTGWYVSSRRVVAFLAGCMTALSLELLSFANVVMTEVPYTLALSACVCLMVRFHRAGARRDLVLASLLAGISYLFRPLGITLIALCIVAALHRAWTDRPRPNGKSGPLAENLLNDASSSFLRQRNPRTLLYRFASLVFLALLPATVVVAGPMMYTAASRAGQGSVGTDSASLAWMSVYHRAVLFDGLDSADSTALNEIRSVVEQAKREGHLPDTASHRRWWEIGRAYRAVRGASLAETSSYIRQAAMDIVSEHPKEFIRDTLIYIKRILLMPDGTYRFQPGVSLSESGRLDEEQAILFAGQFEQQLRSNMDADVFTKYVPLKKHSTSTTPFWSAVARWYYRQIESGLPLTGLADSPFEEFVLLCVVGGLFSLLHRERFTWALIGGVVFAQVALSALLAGPIPRYAVPAYPLMNLFAAFALVALGLGVFRTAGWLAHSARRTYRR